MDGDGQRRYNSNEVESEKSVQSHRSWQLKYHKVGNQNHKNIHATIYFVRNKVKAFKKEHLNNRSKFDFIACLKCFEEEILPQWKIGHEKVKSYQTFMKMSLRKKMDEDTIGSDEYIDLISMSRRAQEFEKLISDLKPRMMNCLINHVYKSCASMKEMIQNQLLVSVCDYDMVVSQHKEGTQAKMDELENNLTSYRNMINPFLNLIKNGDNNYAMINTICNNILELCKLVENWVNDDERYPEKLVREFKFNKKIRNNFNVSFLEIQMKLNENTEEIERLKKSVVKAETGYFNHRKNKRKLKTRKVELEKKKQTMLDRINRQKNELDAVKKSQRDAGAPSKKESATFQEKLCHLEASIQKLEDERKKVNRQLKKLGQDMKPVNETTYEHKVDAVTFRHRKEEIEKLNKSLEDEMKTLQDRVSTIDANNDMLMKVRDMKLSPETLRKCLREKQKLDSSLSDGSQNLTDACTFAARHIGKDWQQVYLNLPFDPPRDMVKRNRDVDILDYIAARNDNTWSEQALKSLEKWRSFHRRGNVKELIQTLRCIQKGEIANDLENQFVKVVM